jgi:hypothetical protein
MDRISVSLIILANIYRSDSKLRSESFIDDDYIFENYAHFFKRVINA